MNIIIHLWNHSVAYTNVISTGASRCRHVMVHITSFCHGWYFVITQDSTFYGYWVIPRAKWLRSWLLRRTYTVRTHVCHFYFPFFNAGAVLLIHRRRRDFLVSTCVLPLSPQSTNNGSYTRAPQSSSSLNQYPTCVQP